MTEPCPQCPFKGCEGCRYQGDVLLSTALVENRGGAVGITGDNRDTTTFITERAAVNASRPRPNPSGHLDGRRLHRPHLTRTVALPPTPFRGRARTMPASPIGAPDASQHPPLNCPLTTPGDDRAGSRDGEYVVIDRTSEECLIRSFFVKHDGFMDKWNMAAAFATAWTSVSSKAIRGVAVHELKRLQKENPEWKTWERDDVRLVLTKRSITPSTAREMTQPNPTVRPTGRDEE